MCYLQGVAAELDIVHTIGGRRRSQQQGSAVVEYDGGSYRGDREDAEGRGAQGSAIDHRS